MKGLFDSKEGISRAGLVAIIVVVAVIMSGVYFLIPPAPTPTPTPTSTPTPTPTLRPGPKPSPKFTYDVELASLAGFNLTTSEFQGDASPVFVLPPGGSGTVPVKLSSTGDEDYTISLSMNLAGERGVEFDGVRYTFSPSTLSLKAGSQAESILIIEADRDAPTAYYEPNIEAYVEEWGGSIGRHLGDILVSTYTPTYIYREHIPTPGRAGPPSVPGITPTPTETPPPSFELAVGGRINIIFFILDVLEPISLDVTSPPEIDFDLVSDPIEVVPRSTDDKVYLLTVTVSPDLSEGTYQMAVTGSVGPYTFERDFNLTVEG